MIYFAMTVTHTLNFACDPLATLMLLMETVLLESKLQGQLEVTQSCLEAQLVTYPIPSLSKFEAVGW